MPYGSNRYSSGQSSRGNFSRPGSRFGGQQRRQGGQHRIISFDPTRLILQTARNTQTQVKPPEFVPDHLFADFQLEPAIVSAINERGYTHPTAIQDKVIPAVLAGKDVVGIAATGSGKTAAFVIPLLNSILTKQSKALIVAPTRELALQIYEEVRFFSKSVRINAAIVIGGASIERQVSQLRRNPQIVIGTPGRIKDLSQRRQLQLSQFNVIVLDEVDRMLDMGFVNEITALIAQLSPQRQSLFFSATTTPRVKNIMDGFLKNPVTVSLQSNQSAASVDQQVIKLNGRPKLEVLHEILIMKEVTKVIVFGRTKHGMDRLSRELEDRGFRVAAIHGNKSQNQRQRALQLFKQEHIQALLATDVAARGIDIDDVTHVINYDLPQTQEEYIHRIGRTGRAGKSGVAMSLVD